MKTIKHITFYTGGMTRLYATIKRRTKLFEIKTFIRFCISCPVTIFKPTGRLLKDKKLEMIIGKYHRTSKKIRHINRTCQEIRNAHRTGKKPRIITEQVHRTSFTEQIIQDFSLLIEYDDNHSYLNYSTQLRCL